MRKMVHTSLPTLLLLASAAACSAAATPHAPPDRTRAVRPVPPEVFAPPGATDPSGPWFRDVTEEAGIELFRDPAEHYATMAYRISGGVCVLEVDGRPPLDLFFAVRPSGGAGSRLYVGEGATPLRYREETAARGLELVGDAIGCLAFDAEGDGDDDLLVTGVGSLRLFLAEAGAFVDRTDALQVELAPHGLYASAAAGDVNGDGALDLVVAGFVDVDSAETPTGCDGCAVDVGSYAPIPSLLLLGDPGGHASFRDATDRLAPALAEAEPTLVVAVSDLDDDGRSDIYVGNDMGWIFRDRALCAPSAGAPLVDATDRVGLAHDARGHGIDTMGWSTGDVDGDLRLDHVATSFEGHASAVFLCGADGFCEDRGPELGTGARAASFRWGTALVDLDVDGDPELIEATGHVYTEREASAVGMLVEHRQRPSLMMNTGGGTLVPVEPESGDGLSTRHAARGITVADLDDDGRPDVVLATSTGRPALLRNVRSPHGRWLRVVLRGRAPNAAAVGARVWVHGATTSVVRERTAGEGYLGSFDSRLLFGLVDDGPYVVEVRWPDGRESRVEGITGDREVTVAEP